MNREKKGGFAERIVVPRSTLYILPDSVSYAQAALTEPLANGIHMARLTPVNYEDVIVIGASTLGLMALQAYRLNGALERGQEIFTRLVESPQELVKAVFVF